jgi:hypothetical protein
MTTCAQDWQAAQCGQASQYDPCNFVNFQSYFLGVGEFFCAAPVDAGADTGAGADAGADALVVSDASADSAHE